MELFEASETFLSLSQETRLKVFKLLIQYGSSGLMPSKIAAELKIPDNTLSFHLSHMSKSGLVTSKKDGRSLTYYANTELIKTLICYLQENCCALEKKSKSNKKRTC
jgi:DNA-binding transcriptional ArsR family regulator